MIPRRTVHDITKLKKIMAVDPACGSSPLVQSTESEAPWRLTLLIRLRVAQPVAPNNALFEDRRRSRIMAVIALRIGTVI
jgi:hypothetical protein